MKVTKIVSKIPKGSIDEDLERYLRNERELERKQKIECVINLLRQNPDINEEMVRQDLREYLSVAKREYLKELKSSSKTR